MTMTSPEVRPDDVAAARDVLWEVVALTPLLHSRVLSDRLGGPVFLKCENLQRTGSFKPRGAYLRISRPGHCDEVVSELRQAGYTLLFG